MMYGGRLLPDTPEGYPRHGNYDPMTGSLYR
jgi:hypothetical protein